MVLLGQFGHCVLLVRKDLPITSCGIQGPDTVWSGRWAPAFSKEPTAFIFKVKMKLKASILRTVSVTDQTTRFPPIKLHGVVTYKTTV